MFTKFCILQSDRNVKIATARYLLPSWRMGGAIHPLPPLPWPSADGRIPPFRKVKCTLVQALRLCTGRTADRGSRGIALPFHDHGTRRGWGVRVTPRPLFTPGKFPVPIVQEAGWAPGPFWTGAENLAPHRDSIPPTLLDANVCTAVDIHPFFPKLWFCVIVKWT